MMRHAALRSHWRRGAVALLLTLAWACLLTAVSARAQSDKYDQGRLSYVLHRMASAAERGEIVAQSAGGWVDSAHETVTVVIELEPGAGTQPIASYVESLGGHVEIALDGPGLVKATLPLRALRTLSRHADVRHVRLPHRLQAHAVTSEGSEAIRAPEFAARKGVDGAGVTVAVVDMSFARVQEMVGNGELPADTTFSETVQARLDSYDSPHGTACAEIVHDVAPGAHLVLTQAGDDVSLYKGLVDASVSGASIISFSLGLDDVYPPDGASFLATEVDRLATRGILFVVAAGNAATGFHKSLWSDVDGNNFMEFSGRTEMLPIYVWPGDEVRLRWDDTARFATHDYDLYVVTDAFRDNQALDGNPAILAASADVQNGTGDPFEDVTLDVDEPQWVYVVVRHDPASPTSIQPLYVWTSGYMDPGFTNPDGSISTPADAKSAVAVGAVAIDGLEVEPYSSRGPTNDGRIKPELVAPDGVSTLAYGERAFYGTSAATPHVAGAAALILAAEPGLTAFELRDRLLAATPRTPEEADNVMGRGLLDLDRTP